MFLRRFALVAILLVATGLRVIGVDNFPSPLGATPPGLEHDEVAHWLINRDILAGEHAIYFIEAYGHEALYHYAQALFGAAVGDHALALRLPSVYLGVLLVAVGYAPVSYTHLDVYKRQGLYALWRLVAELRMKPAHAKDAKEAKGAKPESSWRPWPPSRPLRDPLASLLTTRHSPLATLAPVSYTHLDVYKRQAWNASTSQ